MCQVKCIALTNNFVLIYLQKIAEQFQSLPMFQVLDAEKKFIKADVDNSGVILSILPSVVICSY